MTIFIVGNIADDVIPFGANLGMKCSCHEEFMLCATNPPNHITGAAIVNNNVVDVSFIQREQAQPAVGVIANAQSLISVLLIVLTVELANGRLNFTIGVVVPIMQAYCFGR